MTKIRERQDIEPAVDDFHELFTRPITTASKFYTYYYLSEVKDFDETGFKLMQFGRKLSDAFVNYSLYACLREYTNVRRKFTVGDVPIQALSRASRGLPLNDHNEGRIASAVERSTFSFTEGLVEHYEDKLSNTINLRMDVPPAKNLAIQLMTNWRLDFRPPGEREDISDFMLQADRMYGYADDIGKMFTALAFIFGYEWTSEDYMDYDDGWSTNYGGEAWARVAETAWEQRQDLGDSAYIDLMWSVEHNNGNFIDKVDPYPEEEFRRFRESDLAEDFRQPTVEHLMKDVRMKELVQEVLQAARQENIKPLFQIASQDDRDLRRFRGEFM